MTAGKVWLVGAGPGEPGLLCVRGREVLARADVVLYDALSHPGLLEHCRPDAELRDVGKRGGRQSPSQAWITDQLVALAREGRAVVRLKGGDPLLFARGAEEAEALVDAGVPFEIVPGLSSPVATAAYAGIPLTHRDLSSSVTFITGSDREGVEWSPEHWRKLATATDTLCVLMGMRRIREITEAIIEGGRAPETPAAVIMWGARPEQRVVTGTLGTLAALARREGLTNPAVIVVGEVVSLRDKLRWYDNRPLFGRRVLVPRPAGQARATAAAIRDRAAEPVVFPCIEIRDPPEPDRFRAAVERLATYDWVLLTSANGVERLFAELEATGRDARAFGTAKVGVIGPRTAEALARHGVRADVQAEEYVGESLARAVLERGGKRALLLRALVARETLPEMLREGGVEVDLVPAYATHPVSAEERRRLRRLFTDGAVDVVLFTSSSTVDAVVDLLGADASDLLGRVTVGSIGPVTSRRAAERGVGVTVTAEEYTVAGLLDALEGYFARGRG